MAKIMRRHQRHVWPNQNDRQLIPPRLFMSRSRLQNLMASRCFLPFDGVDWIICMSDHMRAMAAANFQYRAAADKDKSASACACSTVRRVNQSPPFHQPQRRLQWARASSAICS
ncbi:hypothetical protein KCP77_13040 [Salmonella enterica subsp. enterica]|nr:hypothetical protein KCP77_13040 [Salmonella enterica subsp. enterica]